MKPHIFGEKKSFVLCSISNLFILKCNMLKMLLCLFVLRLTWHRISSSLLLIPFRKMSKSDMYSKKTAYFLCSNESLHQSSSSAVCSLIGAFSLMRGV